MQTRSGPSKKGGAGHVLVSLDDYELQQDYTRSHITSGESLVLSRPFNFTYIYSVNLFKFSRVRGSSQGHDRVGREQEHTATFGHQARFHQNTVLSTVCIYIEILAVRSRQLCFKHNSACRWHQRVRGHKEMSSASRLPKLLYMSSYPSLYYVGFAFRVAPEGRR